jgi:hypothetical protein
MKALMLLSAAAALSAAEKSGAQVTPAKPDSLCTSSADGRVECRIYRTGGDSTLNRVFYRTDSAMAKRAALGIEVRSTGTRRDTLGVFVDAVTPIGPAEAAGIVEGDRIASINGVDLRTTAADTEDSYTNGIAAHRLSREVQKLSPGSRVSLRIYSGGRARDVQVTAGKASDVMRFSTRSLMPGMPGMMRLEGPEGMMFGPDMPMLRERLRELPNKIQLRSPMRYRTFSPTRARVPAIYKADRGQERNIIEPDAPNADEMVFDDGDSIDFDEPFVLDFEEPFDVLDEIELVSPDVIRELVSIAARDARAALKQLVEAGIA